MDAAERKEILDRYRDHSRRFEAAAARRGSGRARVGDPVRSARPPRARAGADRPRDRGAPAGGRRSRQPRDRTAALPLGGDSEVARATSTREASSAQQSPRRSCWLPAWAHCLTSGPSFPSHPRPSAIPQKRDASYGRRNEDSDGLPVLHAGMHGGAKEIANEGLPHRVTPGLGTDGEQNPIPRLGDSTRIDDHRVSTSRVAGLRRGARGSGVGLGRPVDRTRCGDRERLGRLGPRATAAIAERGTVRLSETTEPRFPLVLTLFAAVLFGPLAGGLVGAASELGDPSS